MLCDQFCKRYYFFQVIENEVNTELAQTSISVEQKEEKSMGKAEEKPRCIPPPGSGQRIYEIDPHLLGHRAHLDYR